MHKTAPRAAHATQHLTPAPASVEHIEANAGTTILTGQQLQHALYIVIEGAVEILNLHTPPEQPLTQVDEGGTLYRGLLEKLATPPEQTILRAISKTTLLKISSLTSSNSPSGLHLTQQSALFTDIPLEDANSNWFTYKHYSAGSVLFNQDNACDNFYLILAGRAAVTQNLAGDQEPMHQLGAGQYVGDHAIIHHEPHRHTVTAVTPLSVIAIRAKHFALLHRHHNELRERLKLFGALSQIPGNGTLTLHKTHNGAQTLITSVYQFPNEQTLSISKQANQTINTITFENHKQIKTTDIKEYEFTDAQHQRSRKLILNNNRLTTIVSSGHWDDINTLVLRLLTCKKPKPWELALFRQDGALHPSLSNHHAKEVILCKCANVSKGSITQAISRGHNDLTKLANETGASKTCGNCSPLLEALLGYSNMQLVDIASVEEVSPEVKSFRFQPRHGEFPTHSAGEHIRVQAFIDGKWVQRSYTLTSPSNQTHYYEITVKREPNGYFSRWLHDELTENSIVRVSPPQGGYTLSNSEHNNTLIYLVAGIGITPAIAKLRSNQTQQEIYIDYSASTENSFSYKDELKTLEQLNDNVYVNFRTTADQQRINKETIRQLTQYFPNASYIVCGPAGYESAVCEYLCEHDVPSERVHVESFTNAHNRKAARRLEKENLISAICASFALIAVLIFSLFPAIPTSSSVLTPIPLEHFWQDNFTQQVTGYTILGIIICGLLMSFRKRIKKINTGKFVWWRIAHMMIGVTAITLLFLHTGLSFGSNINMVLSIAFVTSILLGASTMATKLIDLRRKSIEKEVSHSIINMVHILISSALPAILAIHIFMTYYF